MKKMALKFVYYEDGTIELVSKREDGSIAEYVAFWDNRTKLNESLRGAED